MEPPLYLVFFKSKDVDVMTAAFKEYAGVELDQSNKKKPSVRKKLQKTQERKAKQRQRVKTRQEAVKELQQLEEVQAKKGKRRGQER